MTIRDRKALKQTAARRLNAASYNPKKLILIHSGVTLGAALLMAILDYVVVWQIDTNGGGLSGLGMRSILETVQMVLNVAYAILTPFWSIGVVYGALRLARGKAAWPQALLEGFRRKGPVLRLILMQLLIYGIITFAAIYGAYFLYAMTPDGQAFITAITKLLATETFTDYAELMDKIPVQVIEQVARVYIPILCGMLLVLVVPAAYRMRLAPYVLMDEYGTGAWKAIRTSGKLTRRNCGQLLLLDLSYWWYYLIQAIVTGVSLLPMLFTLLEVELPVEEAVIYIGCNVLYALLLLIFETQAKPKQQTVYALAYDALLEQYQETQKTQVVQTQPAATGFYYTEEE